MRKNLKKYREDGEVQLQSAKDVASARSLLNELASLHQKTWNARGQPGVFSSPKFIEFQERLIKRIYPLGRVQLLRVAAGAEVIGVTYIFVWDGRAYVYVRGLRYSEDKRMKPGFVTHIFTVRHAVSSGFKEYDLMAGDTPYKRELTDRYRCLISTVFQRRSLKMRLIELLRVARRLARGHGVKF
jgi:CelD/BcsL family acetyltransferase involved in cellulose biosynthesis